MKTVAILPNWVGDTILALPVLDALAASGRRLSVLARGHLQPLLEDRPGLEGIVVRASSSAETIYNLADADFDEDNPNYRVK